MNNCQISIHKVENGYTMSLSYEKDGRYQDEVYIATNGVKLRKMVFNAIKLIEKEQQNAD
jgi:hypothetical protein